MVEHYSLFLIATKMCSKAVNNHPHALEFVLECYKTLKMYDKAVNTQSSYNTICS